MSITVAIVDDEAPARRRLRDLLEAEPDFRVVGEAAGGAEALKLAENARPDVLFLDIRMPGMDGLEVVRRLGNTEPPMVVFVTAFDRHAVEAFELCALDYLLKPFDAGRLRQTLDRVRARQKIGRPDTAQQLVRVLEQLEAGRHARRFLVKSRGRMEFVAVDEIDWIEAAGNYAELHVGQRTRLIRETLNALERLLDPHEFVRIHRSRIVNLDRVREIHPWEHGDFLVVLVDGSRLRMSRRYKANLEGAASTKFKK